MPVSTDARIRRSVDPTEERRMSVEASTARPFVGRRWSQVGPLWALLVIAGGGAWIYTVAGARRMGVRPGTMGMAFWLFVATWVAMMAAMMLPAIGPLAAEESAALGDRAGH